MVTACVVDRSLVDQQFALVHTMRIVQAESPARSRGPCRSAARCDHGQVGNGLSSGLAAGRMTAPIDPVCSSIDARSLPFRGIANHTGERQVFGRSRTTVFFGDDMVDRMEGPGHRFWNQAVLTTFAGSLADLTAQRDRNVRRAPSPLTLDSAAGLPGSWPF